VVSFQNHSYTQTISHSRRHFNSKLYSSSNLEAEIEKLFADYNIVVQSQSGKEATIYCPFHKNTHSPAFYINLKTGLWQCFNPSCDKRGNFRQLYKHITGKAFGGERHIDPKYLQYQLDQALLDKKEEELSLDSISIDFDTDQINLLTPLVERGLTVDTLKYLEIGFSSIKERIVIPVRDYQYKVVGLIGRAVYEWQDPRYLYNKGFKRADVLFNIQNAKHFDECIVVEGSLDCAKVVQAGFKNCVATLGAKVSEKQSVMLRKYFDKIIVFSDNDDAGRSMCDAIIKSCDGKDVSIMKVPEGLKDPGEMSEHEIKTTYENKYYILGGR